MPLPFIAAAGAFALKAVVGVVKGATAIATKVAGAVKAVGASLKTAGATAIKATKPMVSKLSSSVRPVAAKLKSAGIQVKQRVSTSVQNRVQSNFGNTSSVKDRIIKKALQEKEPQKAEVSTQPKGELQVQHGEQKKMEIIPAHIYSLVSNGNYTKPTPSTEPKPDVAPEAQPNAKPQAKAPKMKMG
jgi:hypothetical protein|tara:strand:+ start:286 stop:846 length:561 start_codon:yes stop_codon:yes gene_type:complete